MPDDTSSAEDAAQGGRFFGKYRGTVVNHFDPNNRGRIQVMVPEVLGENTIVWALPCVPYAGNGVGFRMIPPIGANVWVEFEAGNLRDPIWAGCFWNSGEIAGADIDPSIHFIRTNLCQVRIDDMRGEIVINTQAASITLNMVEAKIEAAIITQDSGSGGKTQVTAAGFDAQQGAFRVI